MKGKTMLDKNYYKILEISEKASLNEIKTAYYRLAKKYHPDVNPNASNYFIQINEAYEVLTDPQKRKQFDELNHLHETVVEYEYNGISEKKAKEFQERIDKIRKELDEMLETRNAFFDYYKDFRYYQDPKRESMFTIISQFNQYRFENAIAGIWNRNIFAMLGVLFVFILGLPLLLLSKFFWFLQPSKPRRFSWHWISHIHNMLYINHLFGSLLWMITLIFFIVLKFVWTTLYCVYWLFRNIVRFFLLPVAIILATIIRVILPKQIAMNGGLKKF